MYFFINFYRFSDDELKLSRRISKMDDKLRELMERQKRDEDERKQHQSRKRR